jgi:two-component system, OmpR family, KDP operon response regulator KdpE
MSERILVCDPDPQVRRALQLILRGAGHEVLVTGTGREALGWVAAERPQAVILELTLPDLDGIELCRRLRGYSELAILVLSAIDEETAKIEALGSGADDYVTKPYSPGELVARLGAQLRGSTAAGGELRFEGDGLVIDLAGHSVTIAGVEIHLTRSEFSLLRALAMSRGPVTHRALATELWGPSKGAMESGAIELRLRRHIAALRAKLEGDHRRNLIITEFGIGYRFGGAAPTASAFARAANGRA